MAIDGSRRGDGNLGGGLTCPHCEFVYSNPHPSAKQRRAHKKHCGVAASKSSACPDVAIDEKVLDEQFTDEISGNQAVERKGNGVERVDEFCRDAVELDKDASLVIESNNHIIEAYPLHLDDEAQLKDHVGPFGNFEEMESSSLSSTPGSSSSSSLASGFTQQDNLPAEAESDTSKTSVLLHGSDKKSSMNSELTKMEDDTVNMISNNSEGVTTSTEVLQDAEHVNCVGKLSNDEVFKDGGLVPAVDSSDNHLDTSACSSGFEHQIGCYDGSLITTEFSGKQNSVSASSEHGLEVELESAAVVGPSFARVSSDTKTEKEADDSISYKGNGVCSSEMAVMENCNSSILSPSALQSTERDYVDNAETSIIDSTESKDVSSNRSEMIKELECKNGPWVADFTSAECRSNCLEAQGHYITASSSTENELKLNFPLVKSHETCSSDKLDHIVHQDGRQYNTLHENISVDQAGVKISGLPVSSIVQSAALKEKNKAESSDGPMVSESMSKSDFTETSSQIGLPKHDMHQLNTRQDAAKRLTIPTSVEEVADHDKKQIIIEQVDNEISFSNKVPDILDETENIGSIVKTLLNQQNNSDLALLDLAFNDCNNSFLGEEESYEGKMEDHPSKLTNQESHLTKSNECYCLRQLNTRCTNNPFVDDIKSTGISPSQHEDVHVEFIQQFSNSEDVSNLVSSDTRSCREEELVTPISDMKPPEDTNALVLSDSRTKPDTEVPGDNKSTKTDTDTQLQTNDTGSNLTIGNILGYSIDYDIFDAPSFVTLVEIDHRSTPNPDQSTRNSKHEPEGRQEKEEPAATANTSSRKPHLMLKNLLAEATFDSFKHKVFKSHDHKLSMKKSRTSHDVSRSSNAANSRMSSDKNNGSPLDAAILRNSSDKYNSSTLSQALNEGWNSPAKLPLTKNDKKKKSKGRQAYLPFMCCPSLKNTLP